MGDVTDVLGLLEHSHSFKKNNDVKPKGKGLRVVETNMYSHGKTRYSVECCIVQQGMDIHRFI